MIRLVLIIAALYSGFINVRGAFGDTLRNSNYSIEINQFVTGSGYGSGTELHFSVTEGKRSLHIGFYYCTDVKRITGIIAHHEVGLLRNHYKRIIRPYVFYNGIARITKLEDVDDISPAVNTPGIYKTFEHHIGIGMRAQISRSIYFNGSAGYGIYFGSLRKTVTIEGTNEITGGNGLAPLVKLGFGIIL